MHELSKLILCLLLLTAFPALADQDADFVAAHDAYRAGDAATLRRFGSRLEGTPLAAYVTYFRLSVDLENATEADIMEFLSLPEDTPLIDQLRGDWLRLLGKNRQWELFDREYYKLINEDTELTCYALQSRLRKTDPGALHEARTLWLTGKAQPESCATPFDDAIAAGIISEHDIRQRLRMALESGNVTLGRQLLKLLEGEQSTASVEKLNLAAADALRYLNSLKLDDVQASRKAEKPPRSQTHNRSGRRIERVELKGFIRSSKYPLVYLLPPAGPSWLGDISKGCLDLSLDPPESGWPGWDNPDVNRDTPLCRNPCGLFNISALLTVRAGAADYSGLITQRDLGIFRLDSGEIEAMLPVARRLVQVDAPDQSKETVRAAEGIGTPWTRILDGLGLGIFRGATIVGKTEQADAAACDVCSDVETIDTLIPMQWNRNLASENQRLIVLFALQRMAKQSLDIAAIRWLKLAPYFPTPEQHYFYGRLAYEAARDLDTRALGWYKAAYDTPLDEQQAAWRVRAALREQDWQEVLRTIDKMSEKQQREAAWRYWKGRALLATGKTSESTILFVGLSGEYNFYGLLAGDELTGTQTIGQAGIEYHPDDHAIGEMEQVPGVKRTLALYRMGFRSEALEEWRWSLRKFNDRELITAAEIARRNEMYDRAIGAADLTVKVHDFGLRYPAPYRDALQEHIREHNLEEAWVYGLMRQESRFASDARSGVGASGLMQIMPATARWVAKKLGLKSYRNKLIHQLDVNLRLGTYYMKSVLDQFKDSPVLATAAYNAGPRRARAWLAEQPLEGAIYVETIPFEETRTYVKKVLSNTVFYSYQFNAPRLPLKQRLGTVPGKVKDNL
ncbi:MAG: transglycosylase SLT domain-containing protein [Gallionella sp.]